MGSTTRSTGNIGEMSIAGACVEGVGVSDESTLEAIARTLVVQIVYFIP